MQNRDGRRGAVFPMRITDEERRKLDAIRKKTRGPEGLGPWLLWRALGGRRGITGAGALETVLPRWRGITRAPAVIPVRSRVILDLCAGSGAWSEPYKKAGYRVVRVTLPDMDVRTFRPPSNVWGVLAAPPCDQFSIARNGHPRLPRDIRGGLEVVLACLRIVLATRPRWWALENPTGLLSKYLGTPRDVFEPRDFGDPWTKRTALWGEFTIPTRGPFVKALGGGPPCRRCRGRRRALHCHVAAHRAITAPGFARAFFAANP